MDYFNYQAFTMGPRNSALDRALQAVVESWRSHGGDLDIMLHVPEMMRRCGLEVRDIRPIVRVARPGSALWHWPITFFRNFLPTLVDGGFLSADEKLEFEAEWEKRSKNTTNFLVTPPMLDVIGVKT